MTENGGIMEEILFVPKEKNDGIIEELLVVFSM